MGGPWENGGGGGGHGGTALFRRYGGDAGGTGSAGGPAPYPEVERRSPPRLPTDPKARKEVPVATGCLDYFPDALIAVARLSAKANTRHNPGEPLHWSKGKSNDHADCAIRHFLQRGEWDEEWQESHTVEMAWRTLALLQTEIEAARAGMSYEQYVAFLKSQEK